MRKIFRRFFSRSLPDILAFRLTASLGIREPHWGHESLNSLNRSPRASGCGTACSQSFEERVAALQLSPVTGHASLLLTFYRTKQITAQPQERWESPS